MRVIVGAQELQSLGNFRRLADRLAKGTLQIELHRGVIDAGRRTKTEVQKAVAKQMNLLPGQYQAYVAANTRGIPRKAILAYDIFGVRGGQPVEKYKGLRSVSPRNKLNAGMAGIQRGTVRSAVWNNPRVFKRSFAGNAGGWYAMLPPSAGSSSQAPRALWTFGLKKTQPRGAGGKFAASPIKYGKVRKLFGPSLMKEIPEDLSLATFYRVGTVHLEREVSKRLTKLMRF